jgi:Xaa-Pro dipeptidase
MSAASEHDTTAAILHFSRDEYAARVERAARALRDRDLDGILLFAPESHYFLCGYDTFGFAMLQCLVLKADGDLQLFTRAPDLRQAQQTSTLDDQRIHIWADGEGVDPAEQLMTLLDSLGLSGRRLGVETRTAGLSAYNWRTLEAVIASRVTLVEASDLVSLLRRRKSKDEIEYHRQAATLADDALDAALAITTAGAFEGDILAAMQGAVFRGGGDYAGNEFIIGSGQAALLCRYRSGRRHLSQQDQLTLEWAGAYRHYHAAMMRTVIIGQASDTQRRMHRATVEALQACEAAIRPGAPMGDVFDAHAKVFDDHGFSHARLNACGYAMGAVFAPIWVDFPMFFEGNPLPMDAGNVFFLHMILMDSDTGLAMCLGHSVLVTDQGVERLSRHPLDLVELD